MPGPDEWLNLDGKVAIVTGAGHGIGSAIAEALAACGAHVYATDRDAGAVASAPKGRNLSHGALDVSDSAAVDAFFHEVVAESQRLDILVNNAGVYRGFGGPVVEMPDAAWRTLMSVNLDGVFYCSRAACRAMAGCGNGGRIINIASTQAFTPGVGVTYDSSKAAVVQMTRTLALEMASHGINVNAIAPGATWVYDSPPPPVSADPPPAPTGEPLADTVANRISRIPLGRWASPGEVARVALFFASGMSDYVTGVCLPVDGGWLLL
ncbi:SDR family oxidoreductase [bacterium]|nr:MAG: SDR family oxidoreductase [bacterium]MCL4231190.1 SDR family oxidoreductase [Dehalococcoidia bacterium]